MRDKFEILKALVENALKNVRPEEPVCFQHLKEMLTAVDGLYGLEEEAYEEFLDNLKNDIEG